MCPHEEKLTAWLLGDLPPEEQQALARHLGACASCRRVRDELSQVLEPLRSGLEKDRRFQIGPRPAQRTSGVAPRRLWFARHEGLRRAALFAASFGTLFALISVVYRQATSPRGSGATVTHITFERNEEPAPALSPAPAAAADAKLDLADTFKPEAVPSAAAAPAVMPPAPPAPEPVMPKLRRLVAAERKDAAADGAAVLAAAAPKSMPAGVVADKAKAAAAKPERSRSAAATAPGRVPADLRAKPFALAGASAPTNAPPTNAVPTNAVAPAARPAP